MPRLAKFSHDNIVDATARIAARDGPAQATMARIAEELSAPTGSIYHRFASRDVLLGEVWLRAAEAFQSGFFECLAGEVLWEAGLSAALYVPMRARKATMEARILLLHRREDFLTGHWPQEMAGRAAELKRSGEVAMRAFCKRLLGRADADAMRAVRFALVDAPLAAVQPHLHADEKIPACLEALVRATYIAVVTEAGATAPKATRTQRERT